MVRKIASNYIFLPGYPLMKNGYVYMENGRVKDVVDTGGVIREIQGLEFYGGMIVPGYVREALREAGVGDDLLPLLERLYRERVTDYCSLAIVEGADLSAFKILGTTVVRLLD